MSACWRGELRFAVIMSGGSGRRFWPLSRTARAKHLIPLVEGKTLLELTVERLTPIFACENIIVVTQKQQHQETVRVLERFGRIRVLCEPVGKNTAPCIALAACYIQSIAGDAVVAFLPADHFIRSEGHFRAILSAGMDFVGDSGRHLTLGVTPDRPATGFGYIRKGPRIAARDGLDFFRVVRFTEKPSLETARAYLGTGEYLWNSGIFVFRVSGIREELRKHLPELAGHFESCEDSIGTPQENERLADCYSAISGVSIDYGVMEKTENACVVPAEIGWDDLGNWDSFAKYLTKDGLGNAVIGKHVGVDSSDCLIYGGKQVIATLGIHGLVVIATDDAVLVMSRERAEEVKRLVERIEEEGLSDLL
jgi:mannose-1-phosphate guanylyltransferase